MHKNQKYQNANSILIKMADNVIRSGHEFWNELLIF